MRDGCAVIMPQMGKSIEKGTVTKWLVNVGDRVDRDQPLFEISTDKVDAEIPSPASGVLRQIFHPVGATVPVNTTVAWIGPSVETSATPGENPGAPSAGLEEFSLSEAPQSHPGESYGGEQKSATAGNRTWWVVLAVSFAALLLWRLYGFSQDRDEIYKVLTPAAALLFSSAQLMKKGGLFYKLLLLAGVVLVLAFLVSFALVHLE